MSTKWKASPELHLQLQEVIANHHPHLSGIFDDIVIIFKEKCSKRGGVSILGTTSKAPSILSVLGEQAYAFVIELGADEWNNLNLEQRNALLDHQLCFIKGEEDEKTGDMKYYLTTPDVYYFSEEVERHGNWRPLLNVEEEAEESTEEPYRIPLTTDF